MKQFTIYNLQFTILIIFTLFLALYIVYSVLNVQPAFAQCLTQTTNPRVQNGLITTPSFSGTNKFGNDINNTGVCVVSESALFAPYKILSYDDLKSIYFDQNKSLYVQKIILSTTTQSTQTNLTTPIDLTPPP